LRSVPGAVLVAAGILLSRIAGLVRLRVFAHYFGLQSDAADAFNAAFRIPNFLQNLFGEGALSASFIPVYAGLVARGERREADRVAGAVGALLALVVAVIVLAGVLLAPLLVALIAPGFDGAKRALTIVLVRVLFPGAGLLVLAAWCLGILNSHRRFLLSYAAPLVWNAAMIATLLAFGAGEDLGRLAVLLAWGSVVGSALQLAVQLPAVRRVAPELVFDIRGTARPHVRTILTNFAPAFVGRGVVQISAFVDSLLASLLPTGAVTGLANAQVLYTLPVSLFGMSVAAAELPAMAGDAAGGGRADALAARVNAGLRRVAFLVVPSVAAFLLLGDVIASALLQTGRFSGRDAVLVWAILAGSAIGLLPSTLGRLYSSAYYALHDTRTPLRYAIARVSLGTAAGYLLAIPAPRALGIDPLWGAAGITLGSGLAGWVEMTLLRRTIARRIGRVGLPVPLALRLWAAALLAGAAALTVRALLPAMHPVASGVAVMGAFAAVYGGATLAFRVPEASAILRSPAAGFRSRSA
jgi:putative peptidoglycan lipid II flippase